MRVMIQGTIAALLLAAAGMIGLKAAGLQPNLHAALAAASAGVIACTLAAAPFFLVRDGGLPAVAQAGLASTMIHLLVMVSAAGVVIFARIPLGGSFLPWLGAIYTVTLLALVTAILRAIRLATPPPTKQT